jgi:hypothetical protein
MRNRLFKTDERISAVYNRIGSLGFFIISILIWLDLIYRMVILHQRGEEIVDILIILVFVGFFYIATAAYFTGFGFRKLSVLKIIALYFGLVIFVTLLGVLARSIKVGQLASLDWILKMLGIAALSVAVFLGLFVLFSYLGKRKIDKEVS